MKRSNDNIDEALLPGVNSESLTFEVKIPCEPPDYVIAQKHVQWLDPLRNQIYVMFHDIVREAHA